jgi:hydroxymethylbilane synthase
MTVSSLDLNMLPTAERPLKLGTRASPLAMAQAHMVADALTRQFRLEQGAVEICPMVASGDKVLDRSLAEIGGKALWTKELDHALAGGQIDLSVHSMKDVETIRPELFTIAAMLPRADAHDRLVGAGTIAELAAGAVVGTASPRRRAQLLALRPDLEIVLLRGNVQTRLEKVQTGAIDATLLAAAGLDRLGMGDTGVEVGFDLMLPAPSQGAVGIECRADDQRTITLVKAIACAATMACVGAERAFLAALTADCHSPVAAHAVVENDGGIWLRAQLLSPGGEDTMLDDVRFAPGEAGVATDLAKSMLARSSEAIRAQFSGS